MIFNIALLGLVILFLAFVYCAYRGVKRGSIVYYKRGIWLGILLLLFWAGVRTYFYFRYSVVSLEPAHIPLLAAGVIAYSISKCFSTAAEGRKEPIQRPENSARDVS